MANCKHEYKELRFKIEPDKTEALILVESSEPTNPHWGSGWYRKNYPPNTNVIDIINDAFASNKKDEGFPIGWEKPMFGINGEKA